ncbi:MAG: alpha/beta hydrolase [Gammaproteobacteria bacterium]|jgi:pimeloyl-ACP methyl ester carboxylesterase|nr:MAG: alpha/beta hydrolase [Gammaproteobacteria bacterium]PHR84813.1 MAG: alpha/beta hydrolase [Colwellia sp.]
MSTVTSEELFVDVEGAAIYVKKWIPETIKYTSPIVLMHDSLGCVDLWRDFPEQLARSLSCIVIAYDRLGFGRSSENKNNPSVNFVWDEADFYFSYIKSAAQFSTYYLFGHSVGGGMSIGIAAVDKECLGVITESAQAFIEELTIKGIEEAQVIFQRPEQMERLKKWHGNKANWVLSAWTDTWLSHEFSSWSLESRISKVTCPILVLHGDKDEYGSNAFPEYIAKNVSGESSMKILENCGHVPHKEKMDEVIYHIKLFL